MDRNNPLQTNVNNNIHDTYNNSSLRPPTNAIQINQMEQSLNMIYNNLTDFPAIGDNIISPSSNYGQQSAFPLVDNENTTPIMLYYMRHNIQAIILMISIFTAA